MQLQRGRYQTRMNRIVDITGSKIVARQQPGVTNPVPTRMWEGTLYQMDGKTPESMFTWTDAGGFYGTAQGVSSPYDLVNLIASHEPEAQPEAEEVPATRLQAEQMAQSLTEAQSAVELHRETLGLIRFKSHEALSMPDLSKVDWQALLQFIISLTNDVLGEKKEAA